MSFSSTTYSHAAPYIRRRLIEEVSTTLDARTERARQAGWKAVGAYAMCLKIMQLSSDQEPVEGVPNVDSASIGALREVVRFFGNAGSLEEVMSEQGAADIKARIEYFDAIQNRSREEEK